jgi:hypothetical protein
VTPLILARRWRWQPAGWSAGAESGVGSYRRRLQVCLGMLWLIDAALQFQPFMFGPFFVTQIIQPVAAGNPAIVASSVTWASRLMLQHEALYNSFFATIQLVIAVGILIPRTCRPALAVSVPWALSVWWFGEGLGGIFSGASPLAGEPGGVLLYAVIALLLYPAKETDRTDLTSPALSGSLRRVGAKLVWLTIWLNFSYFLLLPDNRAADATAQAFSVTDGQPGWITALMDRATALAHGRGSEISLALAVLCACAAVGVLHPRLVKPALVVAGVVSLVFWTAEGFGGALTGQGTDPNTGPLLLLLAACYWPRRGITTTNEPPSEGLDLTTAS